MPCIPFQTPDGFTGIVCTRGRRVKSHPCQWCGQPALYQCDYPVAEKKTCDAWICERCRTNVGPNRDYCPEHVEVEMSLAKIVAAQKQKALAQPGEIFDETLPGGLQLRLKLVADEWRLQIRRPGAAPALETPGHQKWQTEIATCRRFYEIPNSCAPIPQANKRYYAVAFFWPAVAQEPML